VEGKTLITFYSTNDQTCYKMDCEGVEGGELLKLVGMLEIAKQEILEDIKKEYEEE